jgi:PAS domain S-box-containing protein
MIYPVSRSSLAGPAQSASHATLRGRFLYWLSKRLFSRLSIAARVTAITLTLAVPLNLVIAAVIWDLSKAANEAQRTSLLYTAQSVAAAVDAKLDRYSALTQSLSRSPALLDDNLAAFESEARRAFDTPDAWILVADFEGQQLINTGRPPGRRLPVRDPAGLAAQRRAFETHAAVITDVRVSSISPDWMINMEVPIFKNGLPFRALSVAFKAQLFLHLLNAQQMPRNWLACLVDHAGRFVARVPGHERNVGQLAAEGFRKVMDQDGIFEFPSVDGDMIVTADAHSALSGWPVAIAIKKADMQAATWRAINWALLLGGGFSVLSLLFASAMARSITGPISRLRQKAAAHSAGPAPSMLPAAPREVRDLWQALTEAAADRDSLRESEERFRGVFEKAATGIAILGLDGRFQSCNPAFSAMLGYSEEELCQFTVGELVHPEDLEANTAQCQRLIVQEIPSFEIVIRYLGKDGKPSWAHKYVSLLRNAAGKPTHILALITDITEQKRQEDRIRLLMREVNHRSKNMLSVVRAVARQTLAATPQDFLDRFGMRIEALAAGQDLLIKNAWKGVALDELVRSQLAPFEDLIGTRIHIQGSYLFVSASAAQTIGMALHELATNAGKYGALSGADGYVEVTWRVAREESGDETFIVSWREQCAQPIAAPAKQGFGSSVIGSMAEMSLGARVELSFPCTGMTWQLTCPAHEVLDGGNRLVRDNESERPGGTGVFTERGPRILVVEDEALVAIEIANVLSKASFEIIGPARNVAMALSLLKRLGCDAAVLDVNLGHETSEAVAAELGADGIPFVTLSGYSREEHPLVFAHAPALTKPLRPEFLITELRRCIEKRRAP